MQQNKAVIFDMDGTLLDTANDICVFVSQAITKFGFNPITKEEVIKFIGNGARNLVKRSVKTELPDEKIDEILATYNYIYSHSQSVRTTLYEGMDEVLISLKKQGYKLVILTNKPQQNTDELYNALLSKYNFDLVVGQSSTVKCKPDNTTTLSILKSLNVLPENAYFVGDGETDVLTSINSSTNGIAVLWGYRTKEQLESAGAKVFVYKPCDLLSVIH